MPLSKIVQIGGYAMLLKEAADRVATLKDKRRIARRRENAKNFFLGATIGTAAGTAIGLLFAPRTGRETRERIARRTGEAAGHIKTRVSSAGEALADRVQQRAERLREAAAACTENVAEAVKEPSEEGEGKKTKKKS